VSSRLKSAWLTPAAVLLLLFGSAMLDSVAMAVVAAVLFVVGLRFTPAEQRLPGAAAAGIGLAVAAGLVLLLR
jgi:hypothetical protein